MRRKKPKEGTKARQIWEQRKKNRETLKTWRKNALERAGHRCEYCGYEGKGLNVHHIIGKRCKELRYNDNNSIVFCPNCHKFLIGLAAHENPLRLIIWLTDERPVSYEYLREWTENFLLLWAVSNEARKSGMRVKKSFNVNKEIFVPEFQDSTGDG